MFLNDTELLLIARLIARNGVHPALDNKMPDLAKKVLNTLAQRAEERDRLIIESIALRDELSDARLAILETIPND